MSRRKLPLECLNLAQFEQRLGLAPKSLTSRSSRIALPTPDVIVGPVNDDGSIPRGTVRGWLPETIDSWAATRPGQGIRTDLHPRQEPPPKPSTRLQMLANDLTLRGYHLTEIAEGRFGLEFTMLEWPDGTPLGVTITDLGPDRRTRRQSDIRWTASQHSFFDEDPTVTTPTQLASQVVASLEGERL